MRGRVVSGLGGRPSPEGRDRSRCAWRNALKAPVALALVVLATAGAARAETIESALAKAYQNNPQLNAQRAIVRQIDENVPQALAGMRPNISATVDAGKEYTNTTETFPPIPPVLSTGASIKLKGTTTPRSA